MKIQLLFALLTVFYSASAMELSQHGPQLAQRHVPTLQEYAARVAVPKLTQLLTEAAEDTQLHNPQNITKALEYGESIEDAFNKAPEQKVALMQSFLERFPFAKTILTHLTLIQTIDRLPFNQYGELIKTIKFNPCNDNQLLVESGYSIAIITRNDERHVHRKDRTYTADYSSDGKYVIASCDSEDRSNCINIYDAMNGTLVRTLRPKGGRIALVASPTDNKLIIKTEKEINGKIVSKFTTRDIDTGKRLQSVEVAGSSGNIERNFRVEPAGRRNIVMNPTGTEIAFLSQDKLGFWNLHTNDTIKLKYPQTGSWAEDYHQPQMAYDSNGNLIMSSLSKMYGSSEVKSELHVLESGTHRLLKSQEIKGSVWGVACNPKYSEVAVSGNGVTCIMHPEINTVVQRMAHPASSAAYNTAGTLLATTEICGTWVMHVYKKPLALEKLTIPHVLFFALTERLRTSHSQVSFNATDHPVIAKLHNELVQSKEVSDEVKTFIAQRWTDEKRWIFLLSCHS